MLRLRLLRFADNNKGPRDVEKLGKEILFSQKERSKNQGLKGDLREEQVTIQDTINEQHRIHQDLQKPVEEAEEPKGSTGRSTTSARKTTVDRDSSIDSIVGQSELYADLLLLELLPYAHVQFLHF
jgi:hypothetical protein